MSICCPFVSDSFLKQSDELLGAILEFNRCVDTQLAALTVTAWHNVSRPLSPTVLY